MVQQAVKTGDHAIKVIDRYLGDNMPEPFRDGMHLDSVITPTTSRCGCGETPAMIGHWEGGDYQVQVAYCDVCGDDDAFDDDVIMVFRHGK
ncbi:MAG: hypothetical protein ACOC22_01890 [bacterium]